MDTRTQISEENLVNLAKKKDTASMKTIYLSNVQYLTSVCSRYVTDDEEMKDILQDSFIKIFRSIRSFEWKGRGSLRAWMSRVVVNEALMNLRSKSRKGIVDYIGELPDVTSEEDPAIDDIPMSVLQRMIKSLPDGYRTIFNLYVFEEMSHAEIASELGISENTSRSQFSRAKTALCKMINQYRKK